ncbi:neural cell adhesion molecule 2-like isoform X7 [Tachypleus tridentatus]|uniref:neural cell adhesion molecule 2-like isoform X7 n=1 Tax=Tachypleus tridentatus TaxID=6853 RepID=UPI003FD5D121
MVFFMNFCVLSIIWPITSGVWLKQGPANKEKPFASILYTAVLGGKVALPCDISSPSVDDSAALILWYKDDSAQPIYTLDARRGNVDQAHQSSGSQLENRAYFNMINRPAFLQLDPVQEEDAGEYRCRVDFHKARTVNTVITLKIIVPPGEPIILDEQGQKLEGLVGPYNEGDSLTIICQASGGKPRPSVTWWRDYALLDDSYTFEVGDVVENRLKLDRLHRHDLLAVLTCQASNNNITVPASNAITIDLNLKPVKVVITPFQKPLVANKEAELTCEAKGSRPAGKISWWKASKQMQNTRESVLHNGAISSILTFAPSVDDNGKYLSCRAENLLIPGSAVEDGWKLDVQYPPQVTLQLGTNLKVTNIQEGNDVYFECNVRANPWIFDISWQFEGQDLASNTLSGIIISNQSLVLQKVQRSFRGRFTCSGSNNQGLGISNEIFLKVKYAPFCKPGQKMTYGVAKHEPIDVLCELDSDPDDVTFHWRFNSSYKRSDKIMYSVDRTLSRATYSPESDEDYGKLLCWGTNNIGIQREPCVFNIVPAGSGQAMIIIRPFLAILISIVVILVIVTLVLAIYIRSKRKGRTKEQGRSSSGTEKSGAPLKKDVDDITEFDDKGPDIIPAKSASHLPYTGSMDEKDQQCLQLNNVVKTNYNLHYPGGDCAVAMESHYGSSMSSASYLEDLSNHRMLSVTVQPEEITYADLSLPSSGHCFTTVRRHEPPTEYAKIDFKRKDYENQNESETSVGRNGRESTV